jgi:hypothetical protein
MNRSVALKILPQNPAGNSTYLERFQREARAAAQLSHPNLVMVYEISEDQGYHYFTMELVDGEPLSSRIKRDGRLEVDEALKIVLQVAEALNHAWKHSKIIHRDIKPDNILLNSDGFIKVADLGFAKSTEEETSVTQTGTTMGTPHYMSPEQGRALKDVDCRTDIYSLGITLFHLLSGKPPFTGDTALSIMMAHGSEPLPDLQKLNPEVPRSVLRLVEEMCAKQPEERYQTPEDLIAALKGVIAGNEHNGPEVVKTAGPPAVAPSPAAVTQKQERNLTPVIYAAAGLFCGGIVILGVSLLNSDLPQETELATISPTQAATTIMPADAPAVALQSDPLPAAPQLDGAPGQSFEAIREYATSHPDAFIEIIRRLNELKKVKGEGSERRELPREVAKWKENQFQAAIEELNRRSSLVSKHLQSGQYLDAYNAFDGFPENLMISKIPQIVVKNHERVKSELMAKVQTIKGSQPPPLKKGPGNSARRI